MNSESHRAAFAEFLNNMGLEIVKHAFLKEKALNKQISKKLKPKP